MTPAAVAAGLTTWVGLVYAFRYSGIPALEDLTAWISHVALTGWLLALLLILVWRKVLRILVARWLGSRIEAQREREAKESQVFRMAEPIWCVVANVVSERRYGPGGRETRSGTKHFRPGAKLHIIDAYVGTCDNVVTIGHHRGSNQYCRMVVPVRHLENFRVKLAYSPEVIRLANEYFATGPTAWTEQEALQMCEAFPRWQQL